MDNKLNNLAFIDGQNVHLGTKQNNWKIEHRKFRTYLKDKYHVAEAYYFFGYVMDELEELYNNLQKAEFIVVFKEHSANLKAQKKGNVDTDLVFEIMKNFVDNEDKFDKIVLVSGDGDYKKLIDYLIKKDRLRKILFPNKDFASSLYKKLGSEFFDYLDSPGIKSKIEYK